MDLNTIYNNTIAKLNGLYGQQTAAQNELTNTVQNGSQIANDIGTAIMTNNNNLQGIIQPASQATAQALTARNSLLADAATNYNNPFNALKEVAIKQQPYLAAADSTGRLRDIVVGDIGKQTQVGVGALDDKLKGLQLLLDFINQGKQDAMTQYQMGSDLSNTLFNRGLASSAASSTGSTATTSALTDIQALKNSLLNPSSTSGVPASSTGGTGNTTPTTPAVTTSPISGWLEIMQNLNKLNNLGK
jgi:hypothetical protein